MAVYNEPARPLEFLSCEFEPQYNREEVTVVSGTAVQVAARVMGQITKAGTASAAAYAGNTGNGAMGAITVGAGSKPGDYKLTIIEPATNAGKFTVEDPDGKFVAVGTVAVAFNAGGLAFTLADGATDFASGDGFTITVAAGSGKWAPYDNTATNGTEIATGVLLYDVDASLADAKVAVLKRGPALVKAAKLGWGANDGTGITAGTADLAALGILAR